MDAKIKKKWVKALRSGKYRQAQGNLCNVDKHRHQKHCCLGVLLEVCNIPKERPSGDWNTHFEYLTPCGREDSNLGSYGQQLGISMEQQTKLVDLNDTENKKFRQIADWIEVNL